MDDHQQAMLSAWIGMTVDPALSKMAQSMPTTLEALQRVWDAAIRYPRPPCNCIATINASLAKRNTRLSLADTRPMLVTERIANGRGTHPAVGMLATHCPFCGAKIGDQQCPSLLPPTRCTVSSRRPIRDESPAGCGHGTRGRA